MTLVNCRDEYEDSMTFLSESTIPGAEEGLFCRNDVTQNTLLSFYHGLNVPYDCDYTQELYAFDEVIIHASFKSH